MLSKEEESFLNYWEANRLKKKSWLKKFSWGFPAGVIVVLALFINLFSSWYKKADMQLRANSSLILTILIAAVAIVIFFTVFSQKHQWDQNEMRYQELLKKQDQH